MSEKYNGFEICYDCSYCTRAPKLMVSHLTTDKHIRNKNKTFKIIDGPDEIIEKNFKRLGITKRKITAFNWSDEPTN